MDIEYRKNIELYVVLFFSFSLLINNEKFNEVIIAIGLFCIIKWITDLRKCTISYIEYKARGVKLEEGYLYQFLEPIYDINKSKKKYFIYSLVIIVIFLKRRCS